MPSLIPRSEFEKMNLSCPLPGITLLFEKYALVKLEMQSNVESCDIWKYSQLHSAFIIELRCLSKNQFQKYGKIHAFHGVSPPFQVHALAM